MQEKPIAQHYFVPHILIAEDCPDTADWLCASLDEAGFDVTIAENGEECLTLAMRAHEDCNSFDLITVDFNMPLMDGIETVRLMRDAGYRGPIVGITSKSSKESLQQGIQAGMNEVFCKKNIHPNTLKLLVQTYCL